MLQSVRVTTFAVFKLLRENQLEGTPPPPTHPHTPTPTQTPRLVLKVPAKYLVEADEIPKKYTIQTNDIQANEKNKDRSV